MRNISKLSSVLLALTLLSTSQSNVAVTIFGGPNFTWKFKNHLNLKNKIDTSKTKAAITNRLVSNLGSPVGTDVSGFLKALDPIYKNPNIGHFIQAYLATEQAERINGTPTGTGNPYPDAAAKDAAAKNAVSHLGEHAKAVDADISGISLPSTPSASNYRDYARSVTNAIRDKIGITVEQITAIQTALRAVPGIGSYDPDATVSPNTIYKIMEFITADGSGVNLTPFQLGLLFGDQELKDQSEDVSGGSFGLDIGVLALFPVNDDFKLGILADLGWDFGSVSGSLDSSKSYKTINEIPTDKVFDLISVKDGFVGKLGIALEFFNSLVISGGFRLAARTISVNKDKLEKFANNHFSFGGLLEVKTEKADDKTTFVPGWFLQAMYFITFTDNMKAYVKLGLGGDLSNATADYSVVKASIKGLDDSEATLNNKVESKNNIDLIAGVGLAWTF